MGMEFFPLSDDDGRRTERGRGVNTGTGKHGQTERVTSFFLWAVCVMFGGSLLPTLPTLPIYPATYPTTLPTYLTYLPLLIANPLQPLRLFTVQRIPGEKWAMLRAWGNDIPPGGETRGSLREAGCRCAARVRAGRTCDGGRPETHEDAVHGELLRRAALRRGG